MKMRLSSAFMLVFAYVLSIFLHLEACDCLSSRDYDCFIAQVDDHIYLNPEKIIIADNTFYIKFENTMLPISTLYSDSNGIYLNVKREKEREGWICPVCGAYNEPDQFPCWNSNKHWVYGPEHND